MRQDSIASILDYHCGTPYDQKISLYLGNVGGTSDQKVFPSPIYFLVKIFEERFSV